MEAEPAPKAPDSAAKPRKKRPQQPQEPLARGPDGELLPQKTKSHKKKADVGPDGQPVPKKRKLLQPQPQPGEAGAPAPMVEERVRPKKKLPPVTEGQQKPQQQVEGQAKVKKVCTCPRGCAPA